MASYFYTAIGVIGAAVVLLAYFANQQEWLDSDNWRFPFANLLGAGLIVVSLVAQPNFPAFLIEACWVAISAYGLFRSVSGVYEMPAHTYDSDQSEPPMGYPPPLNVALAQAIGLKNFAVRRGLPVPDATLEALAQVRQAVAREEAGENTEPRLDAIIRDLTNITWPTTIRTLEFASNRTRGSFFQRNFRPTLFALLLLSLTTCIVGLIAERTFPSTTAESEIGKHLFALSLGLLGSTTYIFFSLMNVVSERAVDESDVFSSYARLILGPAFGWLFFQIFAVTTDFASTSTAGRASQLLLIVPFVAGFSTRLVLGVINQAIQAVELTLGLGDKRSELKARGARK